MKQNGFSLIELIAVLTVILIITGFSIPSFAALQKHLESESTRQNWIQFLNYGRSAAVSYQSTITACPMLANECSDNLNERWKLFTDQNKNKKMDTDEMIIQEFKPDADHLLKTYPSKQNFLRPYLQHVPGGFVLPVESYESLRPRLSIEKAAQSESCN